MRRAVLALLLALPAAAGAVEGFESGNGAWTPAGLWHRVTAPACVTPRAGAACFYFGRDGACDYDDGQVKDASLTSGPQALSDPARAFVSFWVLYQVESLDPACYDQLRLERSEDGVNWALLADLSVPNDPSGGSPSTGYASGAGLGGVPQWQPWRLDLSAFLGRTLQLRFRFVSSARQAGEVLCGPADADLDRFLGYAVDDIRFNEEPPGLELAKSVAPSFAAPGDTFTYTLVASNPASSPADLSVWDTLPAGGLFVGADNGGAFAAGAVSWSLPAVPAGGAVTLSLRVQADPSAAPPVDFANTALGAATWTASVEASPLAFSRVRAAGLALTKSARPGSIISGDLVTFSLLLQNFSPLTLSAASLAESLPTGLLQVQAWPAFNGPARWDLGPLAPGEARSFSVWGRGFGEDNGILTNSATATASGSPPASASATVKLRKPIDPRIFLKAVYPNPAPSDKPGLPQAAFIVYECNQAMPVTIDIFNLAGERVRRLSGPGDRGVQQAVWDLANDWGAPVASGVYSFRVWSSLLVIPTPEAYGFVAVLR